MTHQVIRSDAPAERPRKILIIFTTLHFAFFFASLIAIPMFAPGARIPNPFGNDEGVRVFYNTASSAIRLCDFFQLESALCLAVLSPLLSDALSTLNKRSGAAWMTLAGGSGAAVMLSLAALVSWAVASPGASDVGPVLHVFQFMPFLLGGPAWAGFFAIFVAGICMGTGGILPRWVRGAGIFIGCVSALAAPVLLTIVFAPCLPVARFLGFVWLIVVSVYLARRRGVEMTRPGFLRADAGSI